MEFSFFAGITIVFVIIVIISCFVCDSCRDVGIKKEQDKAIEANVGRWFIDSETGESEFKYGIIETKDKQ